jgi:DNA modification methylase
MIERIIKSSSRDNQIVADPFVGSGTTIIAAHNLGRIARACEIDPGYAAVCLQRFKDHTGITPELLQDAN